MERKRYRKCCDFEENTTCDFEIGILSYLTCSKISEKNAPGKTALFIQLQNIPELI